MITRGTTPTVIFSLCDSENNSIDLSDYEVLIVTIEDNTKFQIDLDKTRFKFNENHSFEARLTQEETLKLSSGRLKVQLRAKAKDNIAIASCEQFCTLANILKQGKI
jgi:hypothetical protein